MAELGRIFVGRIFVIDFIHGGKLIESLREIGMDFVVIDECSNFTKALQELKDKGFNKSDSLVLFIPEKLIPVANNWFSVQQRNRGEIIGHRLLYRIRDSAFKYDLYNRGFNSSLIVDDDNDPQIAALIIKRHFGLVPETPDWDTYFMSMVYLVAMRSKDLNTHIGAVIVNDSNTVISTGYNSFPRGIDDGRLDRQIKPEKYFWFNHGEYNAVANAADIGVSVRGCRMYTNGIPCIERCAGAIINAGIKEIIVDDDWNHDNGDKWQEQAVKARELFAEAGVKIRFWKGKTLQITKYRRGRFFD